MGYIFDVDDVTFWSPSLNVGRTLMTITALLERTVGEQSGLEETMSDTIEVNIGQLQEFVRSVIESASMRNQSLKSMLQGALQHLVAILVAHDALPSTISDIADADVIEAAKSIADRSMDSCSE